MKLEKVEWHRNGICGMGFYVAIIEDEEVRYLCVQYPHDIMCTTVLRIDDVKKERLDNAFRGDRFAEELKELIDKNVN